MRILPLCCALLLVVFVHDSPGAETIQVNGQSINNCELTELTPDGVIYKSKDTGELHTVPWDQLSTVQKNQITTRHYDALVNVICEARHIKGTMFSAVKEGVVVQINVIAPDTVGTKGYLNGAKVLHGGSILVSDLPLNVPRGEGAPIEITGYFKERYMFDIVIGKTEIDHVTVARPAWFEESEWTSAEGSKMKARLLAISPDDKVLFLKNGQRVVLEMARLDSASQEKAREIQKKLAPYPMLTR